MSDASTAVETGAMEGGRRRRSLKKVSAKTIRRTLRKAGIKPKGRMVLTGGVNVTQALTPAAVGGGEGMEGGRRRRSRRGTRRGRKSRRSLFGMIKY